MTNILRIEHKVSAYGPYTHQYDTDQADQLRLFRTLHDEGARWPSPDADGMNHQLIRYTDGWRFGFESVRSLTGWFNPNELNALAQCSFIITLWLVGDGTPGYLRGGNQVAFQHFNAYRWGSVLIEHLPQIMDVL